MSDPNATLPNTALERAGAIPAIPKRRRKLPAHIYHLAEAANWPFIHRGSLLSTKALLDVAGVLEDERDRIECCQRLEHMELPNGVYLRDQKRMPAKALKECLVGVTPSEWYALINSQVFFWLDVDRLNRQRGACEPRPQVVLEVDTERLLARHAERIALSPINTGNARRRPAKRGRCTFVPYWVWVESGWSSETEELGTRSRGRSHQPVELTVADAVLDIMSFVVGVHRLGAGEIFCPATDCRLGAAEKGMLPLRRLLGVPPREGSIR